MPTSRTFQLDVDTKRYVNRVNTYRKINGLGNLLPPDVADIDNFVVGLKDLGVWEGMNIYIPTTKHNVGLGSLVCGIGNRVEDGTLVGTYVWDPQYMNFGNNSYCYLATNFNIWNGYYTIFTASRLNSGTNIRLIGGHPTADTILQVTYSNYTYYLSYDNYGSFSTKQTTSVTNNTIFHTVAYSNYIGKSYKSSINGLAIYNNTHPAGNPASSIRKVAFGLLSSYGNEDIAICTFTNRNFTEPQLQALHSLYKGTLGKALSLP